MSSTSSTTYLADQYPAADETARKALLDAAAKTPLGYGSFGAVKALYKKVEADVVRDPSTADLILYATLAARFDAIPLRSDVKQVKVNLGSRMHQLLALASYPGRMVALTDDRLVKYDTSGVDPLKPPRLGEASIGRAYGDRMLHVTQRNGKPFAFVSTGYSAPSVLETYDLTENNPVRVASMTFRQDMPALFAIASMRAVGVALLHDQNYWNRNRGKTTLLTLDLSDPTNPRQLGSLELSLEDGVALSVSEDGKYAICGTLSNRQLDGFRIIDISDLANPRSVATQKVSRCGSLAISGRHVYALSYTNGPQAPSGVRIYNLNEVSQSQSLLERVSNFLKPKETTFVDLGQTYPQRLRMDAENGLLYVCGYGNTTVVDISEPAQARKVGELSLQNPTALVRVDELLYAASYNNAQVWNIANPAGAFAIGTPPSPKTLGYLKRRVRRVFKGVEKVSPNRYVELATAFLTATAKGKANVDIPNQWAAVDVLFGGSNRYIQKSHGRGTYRLRRDAPRYRLRGREERSPDAWKARPDLASALFSEKSIAREVREMALRILMAARAPLPDLTDAAIEQFLTSGSPLLIHAATQAVETRLTAGKSVNGKVVADTYVLSGAGRRKRIESSLSRLIASDEWQKAFTNRLALGLIENLKDGLLTKRQASALALLPPYGAPFVNPENALPLLGAALRYATPAIEAFVHSVLRPLAERYIGGALQSLALATETPARERALTFLVESVSRKDIPYEVASSGIRDSNEWVRRSMWKLLAASVTAAQTLRSIWDTLFVAMNPTPDVATAMSSPEALSTLARSGITTEDIAARLQERPFLVSLLTPDTFATVVRESPASVTLQLILAAPDEQWTVLRNGLLRPLQEGIRLTEFWVAVPKALESDSDDRLSIRILGDDEITSTFYRIPDADSVLPIRHPFFETMLTTYVTRHIDAFKRDSGLLFTLATHPLPSVRGQGILRVQTLGQSLPFALRLLESEVPPSVALGETFFEEESGEDGERAYSYALALCDSPKVSVRSYGLRYVTARREKINRPALLSSLFENPAPEVQNFVAGEVGSLPAEERPEETAQFDGEVLRVKNRARRAKEQVKARQSAAPLPTVDVETLLAIARGVDGTKRDAEWALAELARLSLSGVKIEGFEIAL